MVHGGSKATREKVCVGCDQGDVICEGIWCEELCICSSRHQKATDV